MKRVMAVGTRLGQGFYERPAQVVAPEMLGAILVVRGERARIVECEAYLGPHDKASHARFGRTQRTAIMFGPPGRAYVYLCYGIHQMMNVVVDRDGLAGAVLIRGVELLGREKRAADGPGKLTQALGLGSRDNGANLIESRELFLEPARQPPAEVITGPRVGIDYAEEWALAPLRFVARF